MSFVLSFLCILAAKFIKKDNYTKCPKCKETYPYSQLENGICPKCDIKTIDIEEYYKLHHRGWISTFGKWRFQRLNKCHYNKPIEIIDSKNTTRFFYAPNRSRYKKELNGNVTYYSGKLFEKEIIDGKEKYKNFVYAGNSLVSVDIQEDDGSAFIPTVNYFHKDALGSVDTITNEIGKVVQRVSYKPFGDRIVGSWQNEVSQDNALTKRGFTGHEHIVEFNLIHMNGRVYDPTVGRFLSADPNIFHPFDTQDFNRYSYTKNNSLKYTDPSGYGWGDNEGKDGDFDSRDSSEHTSNDNQSEENDFNGSEESGDGSGDSFEDRTKYDSRINEQNKEELSRLNLQYKVDTVINSIRDLFSVGDIVFGALIGKRFKSVPFAKIVNRAKFEPKGRGGVKQNIHTSATREEVKESLK